MSNQNPRKINRKSRRNTKRRFIGPKIPRLQIETKHYDYYFANPNDYLLPLFTAATYVDDAFEQDTTGAGAGFVCCNQIVQGTTALTRIANKYMIKSMKFRMALKLVGTNKYNSVRVMIIHDRFPNGLAPGLSEIVLSLGIGTALNFESFPNPYHSDRFRFIADRTFDLDSDYKDQINVKINRRLNIPVQCQASNGNIADISAGALYLIAGSQEYAGAAGITTSVNCKLISCRLAFQDI